MVISWPRKESFLPADRALASAFSLPTRKPRLSMVAMNSRTYSAGHAGNGNNGIVSHFGLLG